MKKTLAAVVLILLLIPAELIRVILANGTIHKTSIRKILNVAGRSLDVAGFAALEQPVTYMPIYQFSESEQREMPAYLLSRY